MDNQGQVSQRDYHAVLDIRDKREAEYRARIAELTEALEKAEEWLTGWASAEPYLTTIRHALRKDGGGHG